MIVVLRNKNCGRIISENVSHCLAEVPEVILLLVQSSCGSEAFNPDGLVPRCIRILKDKFPDLVGWV
jgi:delta-aminolevulinic acid dehydratase/porphobilinogen synthase